MANRIILALLLLCLAGACAHKTNRLSAPAPDLAPDSSFTDLTPGGRLRIVVPLTKSGEYRVATEAQKQSGNTIVLSAGDLIGYQVSYYSVGERTRGRVDLKFTSAELTKDGTTVQRKDAPQLPFQLPTKPRRIRLIYYIRNSQSDHNMAIAAAKNLKDLNAFTSRLKIDPAVCKSGGDVFCSWVPAGIAVRPE